MEGLIFSIVRTSLHDGPGIRTVIYFKGCTLRCAWCHNPEGIDEMPEILCYQDRCIGCGRCSEVCPEHIRGGYKLSVCRRCGACATSCPSGALVLYGKKYEVGELMNIILRDRVYYIRSGGGVTFSGGECLMQSSFVAAIADECRREGIHTVCETALNVGRGRLVEVLDKIDLFFADLKHMDTEVHRRYTGCGNELILDNLRFLSANHKNVVVRIPLINSVSDTDGNLAASAEFISDCGEGINTVELLRYNELAQSKYPYLGSSRGNDARFEQWRTQSDAVMEQKCGFLRNLLPADIKVRY